MRWWLLRESPRAWWSWWTLEGLPQHIAWWLPRRVAYWAFIRVYAHGLRRNDAPGPEFETIAKAWQEQR